MKASQKLNPGRFVHVQDPGNHHGRALIIVRRVQPDDWQGRLEVRPSDARVGVFLNETGGAALATPIVFLHGPAFPAAGQKRWLQGLSVSGGLRDTGVRLAIPEVDDRCDEVAVTVVRFRNFQATIPVTPARTARAGIAAPAPHVFQTGTTPAIAASDFDEDYGANPPLVLVEGSILAGQPIELAVQVDPAGAAVPVSWKAIRDRRPAPDGDDPKVIALSPSPPTVARNSGNRLRATLRANSVGSFHVCPFIDCNGNNNFDFSDASGNRIDREPYFMMNLVLIRVKGKTNASVAGASASVVPAAPTSATGCAVNSGGWVPATAAAYSTATVTVIGGGGNGRRGLDRLFAGWSQHIDQTSTSASTPKGLDIFARYQVVPAPPPPAPRSHREFFIFTRSGAAGTVFGPPPAAPPAVDRCPVLDCSNTASGGTGGDTGTGQWGGTGPFTTPIPKTAAPIGEEWTVDTLDSPSVGLPAAHDGGLPGVMVQFRFNIDFRLDLVFWTNNTVVAGSPVLGNPADRLYSSVQTNRWTVRFTINFDPTTGAPVGGVPAIGLRVTRDTRPTRLAKPVAGSGLEVRTPVALNLFSLDATS
jgi:hypothetical protein